MSFTIFIATSPLQIAGKFYYLGCSSNVEQTLQHMRLTNPGIMSVFQNECKAVNNLSTEFMKKYNKTVGVNYWHHIPDIEDAMKFILDFTLNEYIQN